MVAAATLGSIPVGDIRLTYLPDGEARVAPRTFFPNSTEVEWKLHREYLDERGFVISSIGAILVETGGRKVLVDTGYGPRHFAEPSLQIEGGLLLHSLAAIHLEPADIDTVIYTHLHFDHVGWTTRKELQGWPITFPNAQFLIRSAEWQYWAGKNDPKGMALAEVEEPLRNRVELFNSDRTAAPGVNLVLTPGHTPGHNVVVISSGPERAIIMGDTLHCPVQLEEEEWACAYDVDPTLARVTREKLLAELEGSSTVAAIGHFSSFTFGRVMRAKGKRRWLMQKN